jgi:aminopeptidase N
LYIPGSNLLFGANFISIHYKNKYNNDGLGCMSYIETDTAKQYIYTKFEPYGAHRFIPCFDQPDLKAKAVFNVIVPIGWKVIGN